MTRVYFVRHAQPDFSHKQDSDRPLSAEGKKDSALVLEILKDLPVDEFYSSPYRRSYDTIAPAAEYFGKTIRIVEDFHERVAGENGNIKEMFEKRWADFDFCEEGGESLNSVQKRNINALHTVLKENDGKSIVIGTHGTALSSILNYFNPDFNVNCFFRIIDWMPYIIELDFVGTKLIGQKELGHVLKTFRK